MAETIEIDGETVRVTKTDDGYEAEAVSDKPMVRVCSGLETYGFIIPLSEADQFELFYSDSGQLQGAVWNTDVDVGDMKSTGCYSGESSYEMDGHASVSQIELIEP